jgi:hypothetical protein
MRDAVRFEIAVSRLFQRSVFSPGLRVRAPTTGNKEGAIVKFTTTTMKTAIGAAGIAAVSLATAGTASAAPTFRDSAPASL